MKIHALAGCAALVFSAGAFAVSDFQWTFGNNDSFSYTIQAVSSPRVFDGTPGASNPELDLIVGSRYEVTIISSADHPFDVIGAAPSVSSDVVLLSQGSVTGTLEADPDIAWEDDGAASNGKVTFTVTQALVDAMLLNGNSPGYRCNVHATTMRGDFNIIGARISDPVPVAVAFGSVTVDVETVASGLVAPISVAFPDDGSGRMFVADQPGQIWVYVGGVKQPVPFLDVSARLVPVGIPEFGNYDERGLLGCAFHPDFATNPKIYTWTSEPAGEPADFTVPISGAFDHQDVLAEWTVSASNPNVIDPATRRELIRNDHPQFNHNGGVPHFGPDGYLYVALGDGGNADDQGDGHDGVTGNAQLLDRILGKILRIDVDGGGTLSANGQYGIPPDNPFVGTTALGEIYAYGFRNPYSFSFDLETGDLYVGDVGQNSIEEVDAVIAGDNCGWRVKEGTFYFNPNATADGFATLDAILDPPPTGLVDPIAEYDHDDGIAVIGGYIYRGAAIPALSGMYTFAELSGGGFATPAGRLLHLDAAGDIKEINVGASHQGPGVFVKGFGEDPQGELYVCGSTELGVQGTSGVVLKIVPAAFEVVPTAEFLADPLTGITPLEVTFTDASTPGSAAITQWAWDFGDGTTGSDQNPVHTYEEPGTYTVALIVTTAVGADTETKTDYLVVESPEGCCRRLSSGEKMPGLDADTSLLAVAFSVLVLTGRIRRPGARGAMHRSKK